MKTGSTILVEEIDSGRRAFLGVALVGTAAALFSMVGCGGGGGSSSASGGGPAPQSGGNCKSDGTELATTGVTEDHNHTIQITAAQILAADPNAIFITSDVGHTHPVQLSAAQYASLQANLGVGMQTGPAAGDGHSHSLTLNCA